MMRGDAYSLPISVETPEGAAVADTFEEIEVCIGRIRKTYSSGEITYDSARGLFLVPLSQSDTYSLHSRTKIQLRCKYPGGDVVGADLGILEVDLSISKEVI